MIDTNVKVQIARDWLDHYIGHLWLWWLFILELGYLYSKIVSTASESYILNFFQTVYDFVRLVGSYQISRNAFPCIEPVEQRL